MLRVTSTSSVLPLSAMTSCWEYSQLITRSGHWNPSISIKSIHQVLLRTASRVHLLRLIAITLRPVNLPPLVRDRLWPIFNQVSITEMLITPRRTSRLNPKIILRFRTYLSNVARSSRRLVANSPTTDGNGALAEEKRIRPSLPATSTLIQREPVSWIARQLYAPYLSKGIYAANRWTPHRKWLTTSLRRTTLNPRKAVPPMPRWAACARIAAADWRAAFIATLCRIFIVTLAQWKGVTRLTQGPISYEGIANFMGSGYFPRLTKTLQSANRIEFIFPFCHSYYYRLLSIFPWILLWFVLILYSIICVIS